MYNKRWDAKTDQNHTALLKQIRKIPNVSVCDLSGAGSGVPDVCLGFQGRNYFIEIKRPDVAPSASKLNDKQQEFFETWRGQAQVVRTLADVLAVLGV